MLLARLVLARLVPACLVPACLVPACLVPARLLLPWLLLLPSLLGSSRAAAAALVGLDRLDELGLLHRAGVDGLRHVRSFPRISAEPARGAGGVWSLLPRPPELTWRSSCAGMRDRGRHVVEEGGARCRCAVVAIGGCYAGELRRGANIPPRHPGVTSGTRDALSRGAPRRGPR